MPSEDRFKLERMWLKLDANEKNNLAINKEIGYAYLTLKEYIDCGQTKSINMSQKIKNIYVKRSYKSFKSVD